MRNLPLLVFSVIVLLSIGLFSYMFRSNLSITDTYGEWNCYLNDGTSTGLSFSLNPGKIAKYNFLDESGTQSRSNGKYDFDEKYNTVYLMFDRPIKSTRGISLISKDYIEYDDISHCIKVNI